MTLEEVRLSVSEHMDKILTYFKPGRKITVLVRNPDRPSEDFMMTNDVPPDIIAMIERRLAEETCDICGKDPFDCRCYDCPTCHGKGTVNPLTAPKGFFCTGTTECPDCDGTGEIP